MYGIDCDNGKVAKNVFANLGVNIKATRTYVAFCKIVSVTSKFMANERIEFKTFLNRNRM